MLYSNDAVMQVTQLQSWRKVLGQIHINGTFSHAPNMQSRANSSTLVQHLSQPPLSPTLLDTCTRYFSRVSTLYGGGERWGAAHFKADNITFLKHRKLMQLHKSPEEFCPPL